RMAGWAFFVLAALFAAAWVWSGWWRYQRLFPAGEVRFSNGRLVVQHWQMATQKPSSEVRRIGPGGPRFRWWLVKGEEWTPPNRYFFGAALFAQHRGSGGGTSYRYLAVVLWPAPIVLAAAGWVLYGLGRRAAARAVEGRCRLCGYDRRGLAADGRCPECGAAP
ncbi:MAG TPA: hypothetical protein VFF65_06555, partial [Phycisphaerales bacterium]|nr:hypothetical protein [Phycisphaerales bacterium]